MREKTTAVIIGLILVFSGIFVYSLQINYSSFNFYKSELTINETKVQEELSYLADRDYHTLYRNFQSYVSATGEDYPNSVWIKEVSCSNGNPYFNTLTECYNNDFSMPSDCLSYTEKNEYGCSFGDVYGFKEGGNYWIKAEYRLQPDNFIKVNDKFYVKFVVYNENAHKRLVVGENFIINGHVIADRDYLSDEQVIIYIPYEKSTAGLNIINQENFEFDDKNLRHFILLLLSLCPGIIFFSIWNFFGKERSKIDVPKRLSMYPNKRKASEVAAFFNLPFGSASPNLVPALLTDFYYRKIIDIKTKGKEIYVKINRYNKNSLNKIEKEFIHILKFFNENSRKEDRYFLLDYSKINWKDKIELGKIYSSFNSSITRQKKEFLSEKGPVYWIVAIIFPFILASFSSAVIIWGFMIIAGLSILIFSFSSTLLVQFKKDYYLEYQQWQSFKKFLRSSPSMKMHGHKGTIIWGEFLVYATAFGIAKKVLNEMKKQKIITEKQYNAYFVISSPYNLSSHTGNFSSGSGGIGGGFGGAGGGGVGGGGGGGR